LTNPGPFVLNASNQVPAATSIRSGRLDAMSLIGIHARSSPSMSAS